MYSILILYRFLSNVEKAYLNNSDIHYVRNILVQVVGLARRIHLIEEIAKSLEGEKGKLIPKHCDITKEEEVEECFTWIKANVGPVHILINSAGIAKNNTLCGMYVPHYLHTVMKLAKIY